MSVNDEFVKEIITVYSKMQPNPKRKKQFDHFMKCKTCLDSFKDLLNKYMADALKVTLQSKAFDDLLNQLDRHSEFESK